MNTFLRYLGLTCLVMLTLALAVIAYGVLTLRHAVLEYAPLLQAYTCRDYREDVEAPDGNKPRAVITSILAYGQQNLPTDVLANQLAATGVTPAVSAVYRACEGQGDLPVINLFVAKAISATIPSSTTPDQPVAQPQPPAKTKK